MRETPLIALHRPSVCILLGGRGRSEQAPKRPAICALLRSDFNSCTNTDVPVPMQRCRAQHPKILQCWLFEAITDLLHFARPQRPS